MNLKIHQSYKISTEPKKGAQQLDVLTSMANIAGYRAVLDAFIAFPRFGRTSVTASGNTPPAKVFIIGAGVAGLSAIATAHALGAKVYATDVRAAAKEQVESMGAEFVMVKAKMIEGEGAGGYAKEMGIFHVIFPHFSRHFSSPTEKIRARFFHVIKRLRARFF